MYFPPLPRQTLRCSQYSVNFMKMESAADPQETRIWLVSGQRPLRQRQKTSLRSGNDVFHRSIPASIPAPERKRFFLQVVPQSPSPAGKTRGPEILHARAELLDKMLSLSAVRSGKFEGLTGEGGLADERRLRLRAKIALLDDICPSAFLANRKTHPSSGVPFALRSFTRDDCFAPPSPFAPPFCRTLVPRTRSSGNRHCTEL